MGIYFGTHSHSRSPSPCNHQTGACNVTNPADQSPLQMCTSSRRSIDWLLGHDAIRKRKQRWPCLDAPVRTGDIGYGVPDIPVESGTITDPQSLLSLEEHNRNELELVRIPFPSYIVSRSLRQTDNISRSKIPSQDANPTKIARKRARKPRYPRPSPRRKNKQRITSEGQEDTT
ncbi:uncharacterized protein BJX67DRAFT_151127 [Aspergillus lucknowensis]|uniref:Uncharacterized protein n=1 Tax=Aspergillus lucknowensis TaxID=176173 RepID=A0ABR4LN93_9EURO